MKRTRKQGASYQAVINILALLALFGCGTFLLFRGKAAHHDNKQQQPDAAESSNEDIANKPADTKPTAPTTSSLENDAEDSSLTERPASTNQVSIQATGVITLPDGSRRVLINGSYYSENSFIFGHRIISISDTSLQISVDNEPVTIPFHHTFHMQPPQTHLGLTLQEIITKNGKLNAVFKGNAYRVGDWIDPETKVQIITPTAVQLQQAGTQRIFKISNTEPQ